jgi:hypothetical protein
MKTMIFLLINIITMTCLASEGVSTTIDPSRLNAVMEWVENSKYTLDTELDNIQRSPIPEQERAYELLLDRLLRQSGDKPNEFLMRNVLHRTKVVYDGLQETPSSPKRNALARRILSNGVQWAQRMYQPDLNLIQMQREGKLTEALRGVEFAKIGIEWAQYMLDLYYLAPSNAVKFQLMKDMMGLMYNDINNDDAVNRILAPISGAIVAKNDYLQNQRVNTPIQKLLAARNLRRFMEDQLNVIRSTLDTYQVASTSIVEYSPPVAEQQSPVFTPSSNSNFDECMKYYNESYQQHYSLSKCEEKAGEIRYSSANFQACYKHHKTSYTAYYSLSKCEEKVDEVNYVQ